MTAAATLEAPLVDPAATDAELLRRYHEHGDVHCRQMLIERHLGLVRRLAGRYAHKGETLEDLTQVGCVGLIKAIDRFDGRYGVVLSSFASPNILGEIKRHFRDKGWSMRVPRDVQELNVKLSRVLDELTVKLGRSPSVEELAEATMCTRERVVEALESSHAYSAISLSEPSARDDDDSPSPMDALGAVDEGYHRAEERQALRQGLGVLPDRDRGILHMRFFQGMTQSEIAERVGISQMHVSRLIRQSLKRVRSELDSAPLAAA